MAQSFGNRKVPAYKYRALRGDNIRLVQLRPGASSDTLSAEIIHAQLRTLDSQGDLLTNSVVDRTLPSGWQSFRTPEGRLFFQNMAADASICQYGHPSPESVPEKLLQTINRESQVVTVSRDVEDGSQFEALSYVWGDPEPKGVLYVSAKAGTKTASHIPITANLDSALRHLRLAHENRLLWVDAVCINQADDADKSEQVRRIPDLYRSAWRVIAWLGEASADSGLAFSTMQYLGEQLEISTSTRHHPPPDATETDWINLDVKLPYSVKQWGALTSLMERPWFKRVWVLQEITLANPNALVQCGQDVISYHHFRRAIVGLRMRPGIPDSLYERIEEKFTFSYGLQSTGICDLISMAREHACSVPHDKIYGLLGFIGPRLSKSVQPSYQTPFPDVFKELFLTHSKATNRLELLTHCFIITDSIMPSWIPDWRSYGDGAPSIPAATTLAAGMSKAEFEETRPGELEATGILHGEVTATYKILDGKKSNRVGPWLRQIIKGCITSATYPTGEDIHTAFAKLLCRNQLHERFPEAIHYDTMEQWQKTLGKLVKRKGSARADARDLQGFVRSQWGFWEWRKFFRTEHGYLGCGPMDMDEGDQICVLLGLYCPLVIRPVDNGQFKIVGGCYLHGLMDSEALLGSLPDDFVVQQHNAGGRSMPRYHNTSTGEDLAEDPRLGPLSEEWHRIDRELTADDPEHVDFFENKVTGEVVNYDPRLTKTALEECGVLLQTITLV